MKRGYDIFTSPIGDIYVEMCEDGLTKIRIYEEEWRELLMHNQICKDEALCRDAIAQLKEYFKKERKKFDIPLCIEGTDFRKAVWNELMKIPYGEVRSYKDIADGIGSPKAVRAIGQANKCNKIPIIIPCHRVIGKNEKLVGYMGNKIWIQKYLLELEGVDIKW